MRWLALVSLVAAAVVASGSASGASRPATSSAPLQTASGQITGLDLSAITVAKTTCSLSGKVAALAGDFAVGENVAISCLGRALHSIELQSITSGPAHSLTIVRSAPIIDSVAPDAGSAASDTGGSFGSLKWSFILASGTPGGATSASATGSITSLDPTGITIGDITCALPRVLTGSVAGTQQIATSLYNLLQRAAQAGELLQISCTSYSDGMTSGQITSA